MDIKQLAIENLKSHNKTPDSLMKNMKHNETITVGSFTYKFKGICRYYDLDAKPVSAADSEYVCIALWRD